MNYNQLKAELLSKRSFFKESVLTISNRFGVPVNLVYQVLNDPEVYKAKRAYNSKTNFEVINSDLKKKQAFIEKLKPDYSRLPKPYKGGNPKHVLVIPDLHEPATIEGAIDFCREQQSRFDCGKVIFLGDLTDCYTLSRFPKNPDFKLSPVEELEVAKQRIAEWYKVFPQAVVLTSNHDSRIFQKAMMAQIPTSWLKDLKEVLEVPNWQFVPQYEYNGILYQHGEGETARKVALYRGQSVIQGHRHNESYIDYIKTGVFGMQCGTLVSEEDMVFEYAKHQIKRWVNGVGVVLNDQPILINFK